jgi:hypothetical protein
MTGDPTASPTRTARRSEYAERYEVLRTHAVTDHALASRDGLVVLLRQGVAAWMAAWSRLPAPWRPSAPPAQTARQQPSPSPLSDAASPEVVRILAAMTLSHLREVPA